MLGAVSGIALLVLLVVFGAIHGDAAHVATYSVYGVGMILLYTMSTVYHLMPYTKVRAKDMLQRIDHAMVYVFIAATYTPVSFLVLKGEKGLFVCILLWILALIGALLKLYRIHVHKAVPIILYLTMGWLIALFIPLLVKEMSTTAFTLLVTGGVAYTIGVVFFVLESVVPPKKYFWMHEIFHICVLAGSTLHTIMMFLLL